MTIRRINELLDGEDSEVVEEVSHTQPDPQKGNGQGQDFRPILYASCQDLAEITNDCWQAIIDANSPVRFFRHGGVPTRMERDDRGTVVVRVMTPERLRHELAGLATWKNKVKDKKTGKEFEKDAKPPMDVVRNCLATPDPPLPILERIVETPIFAADGTLHDTPGYNPKTRAFLSPAEGVVIPEIPEIPIGEEIEMAKCLLIDPIDEFPFVSEGDRANALGLALTHYARDMIRGPTPNHMIEAPAAGSGKGLLADALLIPAIGENVGAVAEAGSDDEYRKRITAQLRAARPVIMLDNVNRPITSGVLAAAITANVWDDRVLGESEMLTLPVKCVWVTTANNPTMSTEIARRCVRIRIDPRIDRPWLRDGFRIKNLRDWTVQNRGELIWASIVLIQSWIVGGRPGPRNVSPLGSFERWTETIGGILEYAGIEGFLSNAADFYSVADTEGAAWRTFVAAWWEKFCGDHVGTADLFPLAQDLNCFDLGTGSERAQKTSFGRQLGKQRDRVIGDHRIIFAGAVHRLNKWALQPVGR